MLRSSNAIRTRLEPRQAQRFRLSAQSTARLRRYVARCRVTVRFFVEGSGEKVR